jgi:hypothetical protein
MRCRMRWTVFAAAVLLVVMSVQAWEPVGPLGTPVIRGAASASDPRTMYVVTYSHRGSRLMKTTDRGVDWVSARDSLPFAVRAIAVDPADAGALYAVSDRVYRSTDSGVSWTDLSVPVGVWWGLCTDPASPQVLLIAGCSRVGGDDRAAFARSTDQGGTWQLGWCDTTTASCCYSIFVDPSDTNTIYCGGYVGGRVVMYKTTDGGGSWTSHDVGVCDGHVGLDSGGLDSYPSESPGPKYPGAIQVSLANHNLVLVGTSGAGLYRSTNGGTSWDRINAAPLTFTYALAVAGRTPEVIYAGCESDVLHSTNGGVDWEDWWSGAYGGQNRCVIVPADSAEQVFCGNEAGFFRGAAPGRYWALLWLSQTGVSTAMAQAQDSTGIVYTALRDFGVFRSADTGLTWSKCSSVPDRGRVCGLAAPNRQTVWALAGPDSGRGSLYRSQDSGRTWQVTSDWLDSGGGLVLSQTAPGLLVAVGRTTDSLSVGRFAVLRTTDAGVTWDSTLLCRDGFGRAVAVYPPAAVVAGDSGGLAVAYFSPNHGLSWRRADSGLLGRVNCVGFATWPNNLLFAGTTQGVYVSSDNGESWRYAGLAQVRAIAFDTYYHEIYAATRTGVYLSDNGGTNWTSAGSGLANPDVLTLTLGVCRNTPARRARPTTC